jgi:hypothetical protein
MFIALPASESLTNLQDGTGWIVIFDVCCNPGAQISRLKPETYRPRTEQPLGAGDQARCLLVGPIERIGVWPGTLLVRRGAKDIQDLDHSGQERGQCAPDRIPTARQHESKSEER